MGEGVAPILTSGDCWRYPSTDQDPKAKGGSRPDLSVCPPRTPTPPQPSPSMQALALMQLPTPPHGFSGVMACLSAPELVEVELEAPVGVIPIGLLAT